MSTEVERRLTAALRAAESAIGEPSAAIVERPGLPGSPSPGRARRIGRRAGRRMPWLLPVAASVTVLFVVTGSVLLVRKTDGAHAPQASMSRPPLPSATRLGPAPTATQPSPGPSATLPVSADVEVISVRLAGGGSGYGYALTANGLWTTSDFGATWRSAVPAGVSPDRLAGADVVQFDNGELQLALTSASSSQVFVDLYDRRTPASGWTHTVVPIPGFRPLLGWGAGATLDFPDREHGWMFVGMQATPNSGAATLLRTMDGGATWTQVATRFAVPSIGVIRFTAAGTGILTSERTGRTWVSRDGGATWSPFALAAPAGKQHDTVTPVGQPVITGYVILQAAAFTTADGASDGGGVYRSVDGAATWTVTAVAARAATEAYMFAADGDVSVLLGEAAGRWSTTSSIDDGRTYTAGPSAAELGGVDWFSVSGSGHMWVVASDNGCLAGKTQCYSTSVWLSSTDAGRSWHPLRRPG